jgi:hypothetical protein
MADLFYIALFVAIALNVITVAIAIAFLIFRRRLTLLSLLLRGVDVNSHSNIPPM